MNEPKIAEKKGEAVELHAGPNGNAVRSLVLTGLILVSFMTAVQAQDVSIPDSGLNAAIRDALGKTNGPLTVTDMLSLTNLNASSRNVSNIFGLETAHNLVSLDLRTNQLTSFSLPAGLTNLTGLNLSENQLTNITLPPDVTQLITFGYLGNPLITVVLSEPLAATNLAGDVAFLEGQGVSVFTYPLTIQLVRPLPLIGAFKFGITGPPGIYAILGSTDLVAWSAFRTTSNGLGAVNFVDATANFSPQKFYRVALLNPANMVFIPPNTFTMGSPTNEQDRNINEGPQTTVTITRGFWIAKHEVTQGEFLSVTGTNPSFFPGDLSRPVSSVTWLDATNYCAQLTQQELAAGRIPVGSHYRLPTEAEWECAARAGTSTRFSYGDDPDYASLTNHAWFASNGSLTVHPVEQKLPNPWGLYDMEGNVWEWCQDWFDALPGGVQIDPTGPASNPQGWKVTRGGAYDYPDSSCRSATRNFFPAGAFLTDSDLGFRVVLAIEPQ